jgi:hypothetical protein
VATAFVVVVALKATVSSAIFVDHGLFSTDVKGLQLASDRSDQPITFKLCRSLPILFYFRHA